MFTFWYVVITKCTFRPTVARPPFSKICTKTMSKLTFQRNGVTLIENQYFSRPEKFERMVEEEGFYLAFFTNLCFGHFSISYKIRRPISRYENKILISLTILFKCTFSFAVEDKSYHKLAPWWRVVSFLLVILLLLQLQRVQNKLLLPLWRELQTLFTYVYHTHVYYCMKTLHKSGSVLPKSLVKYWQKLK